MSTPSNINPRWWIWQHSAEFKPGNWNFMAWISRRSEEWKREFRKERIDDHGAFTAWLMQFATGEMTLGSAQSESCLLKARGGSEASSFSPTADLQLALL